MCYDMCNVKVLWPMRHERNKCRGMCHLRCTSWLLLRQSKMFIIAHALRRWSLPDYMYLSPSSTKRLGIIGNNSILDTSLQSSRIREIKILKARRCRHFKRQWRNRSTISLYSAAERIPDLWWPTDSAHLSQAMRKSVEYVLESTCIVQLIAYNKRVIILPRESRILCER